MKFLRNGLVVYFLVVVVLYVADDLLGQITAYGKLLLCRDMLCDGEEDLRQQKRKDTGLVLAFHVKVFRKRFDTRLKI